MSTVLFWFRSDLRLHDQRALQAACAGGTERLLPVCCRPDLQAQSCWGFPRWGRHRIAWWGSAVRGLSQTLAALDCPLVILNEPATRALPQLARAIGADTVVCEAIAAPEEQAEVDALRRAGLRVHTVWQSSLLAPEALPWPVQDLPQVFTAFRQGVEKTSTPQPPLPPPASLPRWPRLPCALDSLGATLDAGTRAEPMENPRAIFPYGQAGFEGSEAAALAHLQHYLASPAVADYKRTRNALSGSDFSSRWSPWLATGALSVRRVWAALKDHEARHGTSEGSGWLGFELLWRDYFRFLHLQHGRTLFRARGLGRQDVPTHDAARFDAWCRGQTGEPLVDAAMRELAATGFLSNRLRQVVASYLVHDLACDWRAGAAWFEAQLIDYDVYSNQGNWLYIAGRGTDPRGGRRFNPAKQAAEHDPEGGYQRLWAAA